MAKRYHDGFEIFKTEEEARAFCEKQNAAATRYVRDKYPAHYTEWSSPKTWGNETGFIAWYVY